MTAPWLVPAVRTHAWRSRPWRSCASAYGWIWIVPMFVLPPVRWHPDARARTKIYCDSCCRCVRVHAAVALKSAKDMRTIMNTVGSAASRVADASAPATMPFRISAALRTGFGSQVLRIILRCPGAGRLPTADGSVDSGVCIR